MRTLVRSWKGKLTDGQVVPVRHSFTLRARWYEGIDIRINLEDEEGSFNHYPKNEGEAEALWDNFKAGKISARGKDV